MCTKVKNINKVYLALIAYPHHKVNPSSNSQDPEDISYDVKYALRLCAECDLKRACVHIYSLMRLYEEAVDMALLVCLWLSMNLGHDFFFLIFIVVKINCLHTYQIFFMFKYTYWKYYEIWSNMQKPYKISWTLQFRYFIWLCFLFFSEVSKVWLTNICRLIINFFHWDIKSDLKTRFWMFEVSHSFSILMIS